MKKLLVLSAIGVLVVFLVSACTLTITLGANVSGTITCINMYASNPSVTVQQGSNVYGASFNFIGPGNGTQTGTYSIPGVPLGTYTVYVTFNGASGYNNAYYYINGFGPSTFVPSYAGPTWTETIVAVSVLADTRVDTTLQHY